MEIVRVRTWRDKREDNRGEDRGTLLASISRITFLVLF